MSTELEIPKTEEINLEPGFKEMIDVGLFYGRRKNKTNPKMKGIIVSNRNGIEIINLNKTKEILDLALEFLKEKARSGGTFVLVATQPAAVGIKTLAQELDLPVVTNRWIGGTLTNFKVISKRIEYFKRLKTDWAKNAFEKYTKKERVGIEREMNRLEELLSGLENLTGRPDAMIVVDSNLHETAVLEANRLNIPIVGFINTDSDPDRIKFPIVGNNKAKISIDWFLEKVKGAIQEGKNMRALEEKNKLVEVVRDGGPAH